jgi:hypothetical protein
MALFGLAGFVGFPARTSRNQTGNPKWDAEPRGRGGNAEKKKVNT